MRAIEIQQLTGPANVVLVDKPEPDDPANVIIEVHAAGVTFPDLLQTRGLYQMKPPVPFVPGTEIGGVVRSAPADSGFAAGQRVAAFPMLGGYAEVVAAAPHLVFPAPDHLSFAQLAALPMNLLTAHFALGRRGKLQAGETVLVHGAAGGVGSAVIQLAKAWGATVYAVTSTPEKAAFATALGADASLDAVGFKDAVLELTGGRGVDLVLDPVGGDRFTDSLRSLSSEGRILVVGFTAGEIPTVKVNRLLLRNLTVVGVAWGEFWFKEPGFLRSQWDDLWALLESGRLDPIVGATYPLADAGRALEDMDRRAAVGKLILTVRDA